MSIENIEQKMKDFNFWKKIQFYIIDTPKTFKIFEERYKILKDIISPNHINLKLLDIIECQNLDHLQLELKNSKDGIILRKPKSFYEPGISSTLLYVSVSFIFFFYFI